MPVTLHKVPTERQRMLRYVKYGLDTPQGDGDDFGSFYLRRKKGRDYPPYLIVSRPGCQHRCMQGRHCGGCGCDGCGYSRKEPA